MARTKPTRRAPALAVAGALIVGAACTGSDANAPAKPQAAVTATTVDDTRQRFVDGGNAICADQVARSKAIPPARTNAQLADRIRQAANLAQEQAAALRNLTPPPEEKPHLDAMVGQVDAIVVALQEASRYASSPNSAAFRTAVTKARDANREAGRYAKLAGLTTCLRARNDRTPRRVE